MPYIKNRWRRNKRPCVLCGEETYDWDYVCKGCRRLVRRAAHLEEIEQRAPDGYTEVPVTTHWRLQHRGGNAEDSGYFNKGADRIREALLALLHVHEGPHGTAWEAVGIIGMDYGGESMTQWLFLGDDTAKGHLYDLLQAVRDIAAWEYQEGKREGKEWLTQLVNGELSMEDLEDKEAKK